jgi:hypothetical protein
MTSSISFLGYVHIIGTVYNDKKKNKNMSAIEIIDDLLIMGADEGSTIKVLKFNGDGYQGERSISLSNDEEIDIEGIACEGDAVYVVGSHSCKRAVPDPTESYERNREVIADVASESQRDRLFRCSWKADAGIEQTNLRSVIECADSDNPLRLFSRIPSKENGVDIEGIAVKDGLLHIGFRGPVLRDNWVPLLKCKFAPTISQSELVFVNLGGRGCRDITPVDDGFLILAGPVGDGPGSYQIYLWDGVDCLPGRRQWGQPGQIKQLGELPMYANTKAEGLALLKERDSDYEVVIIFDGVKNGAPARFRIAKQ